MRGMSETWFGVGASAPLPDVRTYRLLRQLAKPSRHQAFSQDPPSHHRRLRSAGRVGGAMSMKLVWTLAATRRRITDQSRGTIKFAAWGKIAIILQHPRRLNCNHLNSPMQGE